MDKQYALLAKVARWTKQTSQLFLLINSTYKCMIELMQTIENKYIYSFVFPMYE